MQSTHATVNRLSWLARRAQKCDPPSIDTKYWKGVAYPKSRQQSNIKDPCYCRTPILVGPPCAAGARAGPYVWPLDCAWARSVGLLRPSAPVLSTSLTSAAALPACPTGPGLRETRSEGGLSMSMGSEGRDGSGLMVSIAAVTRALSSSAVGPAPGRFSTA